jgi:capsular exopolysaccharide synthesis family protein
MSRIDEALKRAHTGGAASAGEQTAAPGAEPPSWSITEDDPSSQMLDIPEAAAELPEPVPVPRDGSRLALFREFSPKVVERLIVGAPPAAVEQYRKVAALMHHAQADRGAKVVMVASAAAGEGKTLTAVNLALTLSHSFGRRVLLVDADFRRPFVHEVFQVPNVSGLNDGLRAEKERKLAVIQVSANLAVLPAGRRDLDPMAGLASERMSLVLAEAAARFDWVILDTPPVGLLPDANLLAAKVDAIVLVVSAGATPCGLIQRAVDALGRERILGVVLNRVAKGAEGTYGLDGYHGYYEPRP